MEVEGNEVVTCDVQATDGGQGGVEEEDLARNHEPLRDGDRDWTARRG